MKINPSDFRSATNVYKANLEQISSKSINTSNNIEKFQDDKSIDSPSYKLIKEKMEVYKNALSVIKNMSDVLSSHIENGNNSVISKVRGDGVVSTDNLDEISTNLNNTYSLLNGLDQENDDVKKQIGEYNIIIAKLEELKNYLSELEATVNMVANDISSIDGDLNKLDSAIDEIKISIIATTNSNNVFEGTTIDGDIYMPTSRIINNGSRNMYFYTQLGKYISSSDSDNFFASPLKYENKLVRWETTWKNGLSSYDGCMPTSEAAALATIMQDSNITPEYIANLMKERNWDNYGGNAVGYIASEYGLDSTHERKWKDEEVAKLLDSGGAVVMSVKQGENDFDNAGHYVTVLGYHYDEEGKIAFDVCDPFRMNNWEREYYSNEYGDGMLGSRGMYIFIAPPGKTVDEAINGYS